MTASRDVRRTGRTAPRLFSVFIAGALLSACTYVPFDAPKSVSYGDDIPSHGVLQHTANDVQNDVAHGNLSILMTDGNDALGARLRLIEEADKTLDLQYFLLKPDLAGGLISLALLQAADRGVRVRVILDDAFTSASDGQLALVDSHPNIEIRIFNPLSRNSPTFVNYLLDFGRVNRRMHNKSLIADSAAAIVGGRNIADEYFQIDAGVDFADIDMFVTGNVVADIADAFDLFWNDRFSVPVVTLYGEQREDALDAARFEVELRANEAEIGIYNRAVNSAFFKDVRQGNANLGGGRALVITDSPDKLRVPVSQGEKPVAEHLLQTMNTAQKEVILITPYFVPEDYGSRFFQALAQRGVRVRVITNSLAATNHAYVHGGYYRHRKALLAAGVELYEVRADAPAVFGGNAAGSDVRVTMHTKAAIIDRKTLFIGSLNFDPRSIKINTELGVFFEDPATATDFAQQLDVGLPDFAFQLRLDDQGQVEWLYTGAGRNELYQSEPGASFLSKFLAVTARILPIESQL